MYVQCPSCGEIEKSPGGKHTCRKCKATFKAKHQQIIIVKCPTCGHQNNFRPNQIAGICRNCEDRIAVQVPEGVSQ